MSEEEHKEPTPEKMWQLLSPEEQGACALLTGGNVWQWGLSLESVTVLTGFDQEQISILQGKGALDAKPGWMYAQEFIDSHKGDEKFLTSIQSAEQVVKLKDSNMRYRLINEAFFNFAKNQLPGYHQPEE